MDYYRHKSSVTYRIWVINEYFRRAKDGFAYWDYGDIEATWLNTQLKTNRWKNNILKTL